MKKLLFLSLLFVSSFFFFSCSGNIYQEAYPTLMDGRYDSEFPYRKCSQQLEEISESVKFVNCIAYYKTITFSNDVKITKNNITGEIIKKYGKEKNSIENATAGTATILSYENSRIALITCAHVVNFEDTIYNYATDSLGFFTPYISSISVKEKENIYIPDLPETGELEILAMDEEVDLALLGQKLTKEPLFKIPVLKYSFGKAKELEWGTFVYLFGFPMGFKTLTKALVSSPNRDKYGSFIMDAMFNRGFSGGIVFAIRDGVPNFELVGMVKTMFAEYEYYLRPSEDFNFSKHNPQVPYAGDLYIDKRMNIKYGITKAIPSERIFEFLYQNRIELAKKGYYLDKLLEPYM